MSLEDGDGVDGLAEVPESEGRVLARRHHQLAARVGVTVGELLVVA